MSNTLSKLAILAAVAASQVLAAPVHAQPFAGATGVPLRANETCALQFFNRQGNGPLIAKVPASMSGRYELFVERPGSLGHDTIEASGRFQAVGGREQVIASLQLAFHAISNSRGDLFAVPSRPVPASTPAPSGELRIYDERGRLVCRDLQVAVHDYSRWNDAHALVDNGRSRGRLRPEAAAANPGPRAARATLRPRF